MIYLDATEFFNVFIHFKRGFETNVSMHRGLSISCLNKSLKKREQNNKLIAL